VPRIEAPYSDPTAVESLIRSAFAGVTLGKGISLRQAQAIDTYCEGITKAEFHGLPKQEITDDWSRVPFEELERDCVPHLDAEGFRYYLPALMLSLLSDYESSSQRVIGTIMALQAKPLHADHHEHLFAILNDAQRSAIALFLHALPELVDLDPDDKKRVTRSVEDYWKRYLPIQVVRGT
jgi:hypothetical protein